MAEDKQFLFRQRDWFTPNTYDKNFKTPPKSAGVYLLVNVESALMKLPTYEVLYVGSSCNLKQRYTGHPTLRLLREVYNFVAFYFIEVADHYEVEKSLINQIQPKFNKQWR